MNDLVSIFPQQNAAPIKCRPKPALGPSLAMKFNNPQRLKGH